MSVSVPQPTIHPSLQNMLFQFECYNKRYSGIVGSVRHTKTGQPTRTMKGKHKPLSHGTVPRSVEWSGGEGGRLNVFIFCTQYNGAACKEEKLVILIRFVVMYVASNKTRSAYSSCWPCPQSTYTYSFHRPICLPDRPLMCDARGTMTKSHHNAMEVPHSFPYFGLTHVAAVDGIEVGQGVEL